MIYIKILIKCIKNSCVSCFANRAGLFLAKPLKNKYLSIETHQRYLFGAYYSFPFRFKFCMLLKSYQ